MIVQSRHETLETSEPAMSKSAWPVYFGIIVLLVVIVVALAGGIIWYNWGKSRDFVIAAAQHEMVETGEKISERIKQIYDPLYAIVGIASHATELKAPLNDAGHLETPMLLRIMRFYPQILSLYVGFDNGDFYMVSHVAGEQRARFRESLGAPQNAAFANKVVTVGNDGVRQEQWIFLDENGAEVGRREPARSNFDPRTRPWYGPALRSDHVELSDLYIFVLNNEPGFTLSRSFRAPISGVFGADLAAVELSHFLSEQRITPNSLSFIFTRSGQIAAYPDENRMMATLPKNSDAMVELPQLAELKDPVAAGLFRAYRERSTPGDFVYDVADRSYIGRVVEIPARFGRDQLLGIAVPLDEVEKPVLQLRNQTLLYSVAFLVFALPLYVTLVVAWIDRRMAAPRSPFAPVEDDQRRPARRDGRRQA
jgi:adenylate cyclase